MAKPKSTKVSPTKKAEACMKPIMAGASCKKGK